MELELVGVDSPVAEKARSTLANKLTNLGAPVPVTLSKDKGTMKLRASLTGPKAVDVVYHIENVVSVIFLE